MHVTRMKQALKLPNTLYIYRNTLSLAHKMSNGVTNQRRPDMLFTLQGIEVGYGEIKPPDTNCALLDEDRARISELCKRQLHTRIKQAKSEKEFVTYGILIAGKDILFHLPCLSLRFEYDHYYIGSHIEMTCMFFNKGRYTYSLLKTLTLPTMKSTYGFMEEIMEVVTSWKVIRSVAPCDEWME